MRAPGSGPRPTHSPARSIRFGAAALLLALQLSGCALLPPAAADGAAAAPAPAAPVRLTIEAPDEIERLLASHLDLARLASVAPDATLSEAELRRLEAATPAQARELLATAGYMRPEVSVQREDGAVPQVRVRVEPGPRSHVERAELDVQGELARAVALGEAQALATLADWRAAWTLPAGSVFTDSAWRNAKTAALAHLHAAGYASARWSGTVAQVDADAARVRVLVIADTGPLYRTGKLVIEGLQQQDERDVRNLATFTTGVPATEALLLDYQERLQRAGLFERASVSLDTDPAGADAATVTVRVQEMPLQQATLGLGISANNGLRLTLEHLHRRILETRATLGNKLEWGRQRQAWSGELASHTLPGLYRNLVGGAVERLESDSDRVLSLRLRLGRSYDGKTIERLWFIEGERGLVRPLVAQPGAAPPSDTLALTLNFNGVWRDVDNIVLPTRGRSLALESGVGRVHSSGDSQASGLFSRLHARLYWWQPLGGQWYGQTRLELGQVFSRDTVNVPETQRFRAGGDDSVRGYAYRSLTPQVGGVDVGGRVLATASLEVAHPISARRPSVWWASFIDAGQAASRWSDWSAAWGAGVGLRWRSPVGPLRADIAYGQALRQWRLHLSVGIAL